MKKVIHISLCYLASLSLVQAQVKDTLVTKQFSVHSQTTIVNQSKPSFRVKYSGKNSLRPREENKTTITSTIILGTRLWKGASLFLNPEIAGGSGLS